jgi:hypothetical protein
MRLHCRKVHDLRRWAVAASLVFVFCMIAASAWGQAAQGTITGTITDPQGAVVAAAKIEAKNTQTNVVATTVTSTAGVYSFPALNPGQYKISVTAKGFKSSVRDNIQLQLSARLQMDFALVVGSVSETVEVTTQAPQLETGTASLGTVIAQEQINNLPLMNNNVMTLMQMTVGFVDTGGNSVGSQTAWSTKGALSNYNVNGSDGFNAQYSLEGSPNTNRENGQMGNRNANDVSIVPPSDAVGEFKTQNNTYDAENGRSSGGSVSISLRSGTNKWHGTLYEYFRNTVFNANSVANKSTNPIKARSPMQWNQPGGSISGPLIKNKLFFMFTTETDVEHVPGSASSIEVPTALEREGDFSQTLATSPDPFAPPGTMVPALIYDAGCPAAGGRNTPINALDSTGVALLSNDPCYDPNSASTKLAKALLSNLPAVNIIGAPRGNPNVNLFPQLANLYHTYVGRLDYTLDPKNTFFLTYAHSNYAQTGGYEGYSSAAASTASKSNRYDDATTITWTSTLKPTLVSTSRINYSRHVVLSTPYAWGYDPSQLGFSGLPALNFPSISLSWPGGSGGGPGGGGPPGPPPGGGGPGGPGGGGSGQLGSTGLGNTYDSMYTFGETLTKVVGTHSLKFGGEFWTMLDNYNNPSSSSGSFSFDNTFTKQNYNLPSDSTGDPAASMLLGYPTSGSVPVNVALAYTDHYYSAFFQDDWRMMKKLTLNLGVRWDYESPETERHDRAAVGLDSWTPYTITTPGGSSYPMMGGLIYARAGNRTATTRDLLKFQPRFGMAYQITNKLVFRGGWGLQASPTAIFPGAGDYNATSTYIASTDNSQTPDTTHNTLANPFPNGITQPTGNSLGLLSHFGQSYTFFNPAHKTATNYSYSAGFQYQLPYSLMVSASYVGMRSNNHDVDRDINSLPWDTYVYNGTHDRNGAYVDPNCRPGPPDAPPCGISISNEQVENPFYNYIPASSSMHVPSITKAQLLLPYPQFSGVTQSNMNLGKRFYDSLQVQVDKRMSHGLMVMANFTWSKTQATDSYLNGGHDGIKELKKQVIPSDRAGLFNLAASYSVPFFSNSRGILKQVLGGWNASTILAYQSGQPANLGMTGNLIGNPKTAKPTYSHWFNTCYLDTSGNKQNCSIDSTPAWQQLGTYDKRTTAMFLTSVRTPSISMKSGINASIFKDFAVKETQKVTFRAEVYNMFNSASFAGMMNLNTSLGQPAFGTIPTTAQTNEPRIFQFSVKYAF